MQVCELHYEVFCNNQVKSQNISFGVCVCLKSAKFEKCDVKLTDKLKQDRRWNADKPSVALDPYIPIWLTTSPANQKPFENLFFSKHWKEIVKSVAFSGWTGEEQLQIWSSHSLILHIQIITYTLSIMQSIMEMLTYFHRMSLNKNCGCMIFSVAYPYRKSMSIIERVIYIYIYISYIYSSWHHIFAIPPVFIEIYRVGDNRRPVNSSTSLHISDQLGTENVWETLLC